MTGNALVASAVDQTSPFAGTLLLEDSEQLAQAIKSGDWVSGGLATFSAAVDLAAAVSDPLGTLIAAGLGWLMDHVEPLKGWFNDLTGNASEVQAFAQTWTNIQTQLDGAADELIRILGDVESLAGEAIDAYRRFQQDTAEHLRTTGSLAGAFATGLGVASVIVQAVHDIVRDVLSQLVGSAISWAAEAVFSLGLATPWIIEQVSTRVASLVGRVGKFVTRLLESLKSLRGLLAQLRPLLDKAGDVFSRLLRETPSAPRGARPREGGVAPRLSGQDPVRGRGDSGPGWTRVSDDPVTPKDLGYGEKMADHGSSAPYPDGTQMDAGTGSLRSDPAAPYGRFDDGTALTKQDYDTRYVFKNGHDNYPPNAGAVRGTRVHYDDWDAFQRDYGSELDRIGHPGGDYLGLKENGENASFEQRGLPVSSLTKPHYDYHAGGSLPPGWNVEVSEIAPAFGQPGGGLQVRILDARGNSQSVSDLIDAKVLIP